MVPSVPVDLGVVQIRARSFDDHGVDRLTSIRDGLRAWMAANDVMRLSEIRGRLSKAKQPASTAFERAQYLKVLDSYDEEAPHGSWIE